MLHKSRILYDDREAVCVRCSGQSLLSGPMCSLNGCSGVELAIAISEFSVSHIGFITLYLEILKLHSKRFTSQLSQAVGKETIASDCERERMEFTASCDFKHQGWSSGRWSALVRMRVIGGIPFLLLPPVCFTSFQHLVNLLIPVFR